MRYGQLLLPLLCSACFVKGNPSSVSENDAGSDMIPREGGSVTLDHCGYDTSTRYGSTAPLPGTKVVGDDPTPHQIHLGFIGDPSTSMAIMWRTADETTELSSVLYGKAGASLDQMQEGHHHIFVEGFGTNGPQIHLHEVHLCGLDPDTEYTYRVGGVAEDGTEYWSTEATFKTAPADNSEITVAVLGDTRDGYDVWADLMTQAKSHAVDIVLFSGDAVTLGQLQSEWDAFFDGGGDMLRSAPIISAHGNHDNNSSNFYAQLVMPGDEENFAFDYGPMHVAVLNDTPIDEGTIAGEAREFLDATMGDTTKPWKFAMHHKPIYSASVKHGGDPELLLEWAPVIDSHAVDMVFAGHDHNYERSKPMRGDEPQASAADGTIYVVAGGAGASLYDNGSDRWTEVSAKSSCMMIMNLSDTLADATVYDDNEAVIDTFSIDKSP
jgi:hypothetical protein